MTSSPTELLPELLELMAFALGSVVLSVAGFSIERFALSTLRSGQLKLGAWALGMGIVVFYLSYLLATTELLPKVAALRRS